MLGVGKRPGGEIAQRAAEAVVPVGLAEQVGGNVGLQLDERAHPARHRREVEQQHKRHEGGEGGEDLQVLATVHQGGQRGGGAYVGSVG